MTEKTSKEAMQKSSRRGGVRPGAGRRALDGVTAADTVQVTARVTPEQRNQFLILGGSVWLRTFLAEAIRQEEGD